MKKHILKPDNNELLKGLIKTFNPGEIILTPSRRLANEIRHVFRQHMAGSGKKGWEPIQTMSLKSFISKMGKYTPDLPKVAHDYGLWSFFLDAFKKYPVPFPNSRNLPVARLMNETLGLLIRHCVKWNECNADSDAIKWRQNVFIKVMKRLDDSLLIHPEELPLRLASCLPVHFIPKKAHLVLLEDMAPSEKIFINMLGRHTDLITWGINPDEKNNAYSWSGFNSPEEEARSVLTQTLEKSGQCPLHKLGIIVFDKGRQSLFFDNGLKELIGKPVDNGGGAYNITYGTPLNETGLFKAMALALRFWVEGEARQIFISMLFSTYYGRFKNIRTECGLLDTFLRSNQIHKGWVQILDAIKDNNDFAGIYHFKDFFDAFAELRSSAGSMKEWSSQLDSVFDKAGFPVLSDEIDQTAWSHILEIKNTLASQLQGVRVDLNGFLSWFTEAASLVEISGIGYENAGIQVMGPLEARGLFFDHLWVTGLNGEMLPQPVKKFPMLSPKERLEVQGGSVQMQWEFAEHLFKQIMAAGRNIYFSMAIQDQGEELSASPFFRDDGQVRTFDPWLDPSGWWQRSVLIEQGVAGLNNPLKTLNFDCRLDVKPPQEMSISRLETFLSCPFKFMLENIFKLVPLEEENYGISPSERGELIHRILRNFVEEAKDIDMSLDNKQEALLILKKIVYSVMGNNDKNPFYGIEIKRLLESPHGLLDSWLNEEIKLRDNGNKWFKTEVPFKGLKLNGLNIDLSGRLDRIDILNRDTLVCWDYKTGMLPGKNEIFEDMTKPQLPAYTLAISKHKGIIDDIPDFSDIGAGYIGLKSTGDMAVREYEPEGGWKKFHDDWQKFVADRLKPSKHGEFSPDPLPSPDGAQSPCRFCVYSLFCNIIIQRGTDEDK